jgi:hypothetical protein
MSIQPPDNPMDVEIVRQAAIHAEPMQVVPKALPGTP